MIINFSQEVKQLDGSPIKDGDGNATLGTMCVNALLGTHKNDTEMSGVDKYKLYALAKKLYTGGEQEVSAEDITKMKERIGKMYVPLVVGILFDILEGK